jgi:hypothetical protein
MQNSSHLKSKACTAGTLYAELHASLHSNTGAWLGVRLVVTGVCGVRDDVRLPSLLWQWAPCKHIQASCSDVEVTSLDCPGNVCELGNMFTTCIPLCSSSTVSGPFVLPTLLQAGDRPHPGRSPVLPPCLELTGGGPAGGAAAGEPVRRGWPSP